MLIIEAWEKAVRVPKDAQFFCADCGEVGPALSESGKPLFVSEREENVVCCLQCRWLRMDRRMRENGKIGLMIDRREGEPWQAHDYGHQKHFELRSHADVARTGSACWRLGFYDDRGDWWTGTWYPRKASAGGTEKRGKFDEWAQFTRQERGPAPYHREGAPSAQAMQSAASEEAKERERERLREIARKARLAWDAQNKSTNVE